jgi:hypothetical protein
VSSQDENQRWVVGDLCYHYRLQWAGLILA